MNSTPKRQQSSNPAIELLATSALTPYARNAKRHDDVQVSQIAASIREFGFNNPVLIDDANGVIAGHGRLLAAQRLGLDEVPCIRLGHLTDTQRRAYIIADNRLAETGGGWDIEMLALEIEELRLNEFDIDLTGFDAAALDGMFATEPGSYDEPPPDDFNEVDEDIETEHRCPSCGYEWSGKSR